MSDREQSHNKVAWECRTLYRQEGDEQHKRAADEGECFWPTGCSDSKRCASFGSCVAAYQNAHKDELFNPEAYAAEQERLNQAARDRAGKLTRN